MEMDQGPRTADRSFERKIWRARMAGVFEQVWLKLWLVLAVVALFLLFSYAGLWPLMPVPLHVAVLVLFGLAFLASLVSIARVTWPSREEAVRRIERVSGVPHRPATSYEDTVSAPSSDPATLAIWQAHRERMAALIAKLKSGKPRPRTDRFDPFAIRAALLLGVVGLTALLGDSFTDRVRGAFTFGSAAQKVEARLDAWLTPPAYTGRAPIMLADGAGGARARPAADGEGKARVPEVPFNSVLIVRVGGMGSAPLAIEVAPSVGKGETSTVERIEAKSEEGVGDLKEVRTEITRSATVRAMAGGSELASWDIVVIPDALPRISLSRPPELTPRGSLKLTYKVEDDYGVASAGVDLKRLPDPPRDPKTAWAQPEPPKGPRAPLMRPPKLELRLPRPNATSAEAHTYFEMASHPWAGRKVIMTLEATDVAGQVGRSPGFEMILPERRFTKPLARAVVEQRKKLLEDSRYRSSVVFALDALTLAPESFIEDARVYLGLRTARHRLLNDRSRAAFRSVVEQLWQIALRIEDGNLSDAERALKQAQDKLAKALEDGASEEEVKQLMQELREALNEFMKQLAQENDGGQQQDGQNPDQQMLAQEDLERMMRNLEEMAKSGSREQAQQLLSEMQDLMERLQSGRQDQAQAQRNQEMMKMMEELGNMVGDQQKLMDDTFGERRDQGNQDGGQGQQQRPPPGMKGMGSEGQQGQAGAPPGQSDQPQRGRGRGQPGGEGQQGQGQIGEGQGGDRGIDGLTQRQRELRDRLGQLQKQMRDKGAGSSQQLEDAESAMESAEDALQRGDLEEATEQQSRALDQMRQGAQNMAQEMMRNMPQRYGQSGDTPRDPLGRPQRSQGPDLGTSVKVPDQIDVQRAREILEELRRRLGEATRAPVELDYLERLLRRF
ncbi:TIGR02302 family protein [Hyphomicrobium sp.]|uniref:TIGR02302 family protein n=1 Tax=Hyphomicrobium sp. TaxID=82 RepID=UPI0025BA0C2C|nr:TIGR02302 family protein [Hyphomicrobium sp.]MCC7251494.1 TIGR02302 family protein [Hyphomicrobium sp.]